MSGWLSDLKPLRRAAVLRGALRDIGEGAHSAAEGDVRRLCRRHGFPLPDRQRRHVDRAGRARRTDCEWDLPDGTTLALEVEGPHHLDVLQHVDDARRSRRLVARQRVSVRCSAYELRHEPGEVATDLIALGLGGRVPHTAA